jgi:hypothetical protein
MKRRGKSLLPLENEVGPPKVQLTRTGHRLESDQNR